MRYIKEFYKKDKEINSLKRWVIREVAPNTRWIVKIYKDLSPFTMADCYFQKDGFVNLNSGKFMVGSKWEFPEDQYDAFLKQVIYQTDDLDEVIDTYFAMQDAGKYNL